MTRRWRCLARQCGRHRATVGADKAYATTDVVGQIGGMKVTPHVARNTSNRRSAIDGRTTRRPGYAVPAG